jgi:hypothetical protein
MSKVKLSESDLKRELGDFRARYPVFVGDQLFVLWFLRAFLTEDEKEAADALCGGPNDKGIDAIMIDPETKSVFIVQGKYHMKIGEKNEHRPDITSFAQLALTLTGDNKTIADFYQGLSPEVHQRLSKARKHILRDGYRLKLYYVTTGKCSLELAKEADRIARSAKFEATHDVVDGRRVLLLLSDYMDGVAPPVPSLDLEMEAGEGIQVQGIFHRYDGKTQIESWVFSMTSVTFH